MKKRSVWIDLQRFEARSSPPESLWKMDAGSAVASTLPDVVEPVAE